MTLEVGFLLVLAVMVTLFLTEKLPIDLTAVAEVAGVAATAVMMPAVASIGRRAGFRRPGSSCLSRSARSSAAPPPSSEE